MSVVNVDNVFIFEILPCQLWEKCYCAVVFTDIFGPLLMNPYADGFCRVLRLRVVFLNALIYFMNESAPVLPCAVSISDTILTPAILGYKMQHLFLLLKCQVPFRHFIFTCLYSAKMSIFKNCSRYVLIYLLIVL